MVKNSSLSHLYCKIFYKVIFLAHVINIYSLVCVYIYIYIYSPTPLWLSSLAKK